MESMILVRRWAAALAVLALPGCMSVPESAPELISCDSIPAVQEYIENLLVMPRQAILDRLPGPFDERVSLVLRLRADGSLASALPSTSTSQTFQDLLLAQVQASSPYPPPPAEQRRCLVDRPILLAFQFHKEVDCDTPIVSEYTERLLQRISAALQSSARGREPEAAQASFYLQIGPKGEVERVNVVRASSPEFSQRLSAEVHRSSPFEPPAPEFSACFSGDRVRLWMTTQKY
jgi:hypothetical protein